MGLPYQSCHVAAAEMHENLHITTNVTLTCAVQFFGWIVGANTMLEYLLAGSTVAKGTLLSVLCYQGLWCFCRAHIHTG